MTKESTLQIQCVDYLTKLAIKHKELVFFSIPNEGVMTALVAFGVRQKIIGRIINFFKKMGLLPGIPDFQILYNRKSIFVEFKSKNRKPSEKQYRIHKKLKLAGFKTFVINDFEIFQDLIFLELGIM